MRFFATQIDLVRTNKFAAKHNPALIISIAILPDMVT